MFEVLSKASLGRPPPRRALLEAARLAAVAACGRAWRDEARLREVAAGAVRVFAADFAAVTLVGADAVHLLASDGLAEGSVARRGSPCAEVVEHERPLLLDDARAVSALRGHEWVRLWGLSAYAGVPLVDADGYAVGTVCCMARRPGAFGTGVLDDLTALAALSESVLAETGAAPLTPTAGPRWLGVKTVRAHPGGPGRTGLIVVRVAGGSPAERAGLRPADLIHSLNGRALQRPDDLRAALEAAQDAVAIRFQRRGRWHTCSAVIG